MTTMSPYKAEARMRFTFSVSYNGLSSKSHALIDTTTSLNFVSKDFVFANNGFYKDFKNDPKLSIRVASEQRIYMTKVFVFFFKSLMDVSLQACNLESPSILSKFRYYIRIVRFKEVECGYTP